ncbi:MAG TPA: fused MFS/spermidine synthase [Solirubrobacterales bacterium]|nr:fused MFS/spermidine synthase [Solirubrobacterales bacterium]
MTGNRFLYLLVLVVGTGSLGAEIAAVRLMAPFFGASTIVWANTIGIVLVALSIGYWLGGRLADRYPEVRALGLTVMAAAALLAVVPFVARPFFNISVDALDRIEAGAFVGSLAAVLVLIAIPIILMGTVSPWAIRIAVPDVAHAGRVSGRIYAVSTVGSLIGVLVSALLLVPFVGTQRTFLIFAAAIALIGAAAAGWRYAVVPVIVAGLIALPVGTVKATDRGEVIYEAESEHQYIRVIERGEGERILELNEGQAIHSLYRPDSYLTDGVWDGYLFLPFTSLREPPERIAILGNAAGTTARAYGHYFPAAEIDGVEIDAELEDVGLEYFDMGSNPNLTVHIADARPWLRRSDGGYDVIMVDAYRQPYIPFYLTTTEFFELARDRLAPGGLVIVNAGHPEGSDDLEKVLGRTMDEVFATVIRDPIKPTNTLLVGSDGHASAERLAEAAPELPGELSLLASQAARRVGPRLPGGSVYTDDRAPVEWLIDRSILGYAAEQDE